VGLTDEPVLVLPTNEDSRVLGRNPLGLDRENLLRLTRALSILHAPSGWDADAWLARLQTIERQVGVNLLGAPAAKEVFSNVWGGVTDSQGFAVVDGIPARKSLQVTFAPGRIVQAVIPSLGEEEEEESALHPYPGFFESIRSVGPLCLEPSEYSTLHVVVGLPSSLRGRYTISTWPAFSRAIVTLRHITPLDAGDSDPILGVLEEYKQELDDGAFAFQDVIPGKKQISLKAEGTGWLAFHHWNGILNEGTDMDVGVLEPVQGSMVNLYIVFVEEGSGNTIEAHTALRNPDRLVEVMLASGEGVADGKEVAAYLDVPLKGIEIYGLAPGWYTVRAQRPRLLTGWEYSPTSKRTLIIDIRSGQDIRLEHRVVRESGRP